MRVSEERTGRATYLVWLIVMVCVAPTQPAQASDDIVLEHLLRDCPDFRVRARAAAALARSPGASASGALAAALADRHPAVREAAATALGQLGAAECLPALRASARDPVPEVAHQARQSIAQIERNQFRRTDGKGPLQAVRYRLWVGTLQDQTSEPDARLLPLLASSLGEHLSALEGAQVVDPAASVEGVPSYRVDGSIVDADRGQIDDKLTARASVALLLTDTKNQTLRVVLRGTATAIEDLDRHGVGQPLRVARTAIEQAVKAALRNASNAMRQALASKR